MTFPDPAAFVTDWIEAWNRLDVEAVLAHFHEDTVFSSPLPRRLLGANAAVVGGHREAKMRTLAADTPLKRFGMPDQVAAIAVTDEATYVTGTEMNIDGGLLTGSAASPGRRTRQRAIDHVPPHLVTGRQGGVQACRPT